MLTVPQMSASQALASRSLLIMLITVQGTTPKNSSIDVQHWIALTLTSACVHPVLDDEAELGHLQERGVGNAAGGDVVLDLRQLVLRRLRRRP